MVYIFSADEADKKARQLAPGPPARRPAAITPRPVPVVAILRLFI
ncbi:MAG TPA: hypothetical protein VGK40_03775 [Verrucomicrobiae bacterium]